MTSSLGFNSTPSVAINIVTTSFLPDWQRFGFNKRGVIRDRYKLTKEMVMLQCIFQLHTIIDVFKNRDISFLFKLIFYPWKRNGILIFHPWKRVISNWVSLTLYNFKVFSIAFYYLKCSILFFKFFLNLYM